MLAVTINTKRDRSKIDWAGVDTGAKIFVGLSDGIAGAANPAITDPQKGSATRARVSRDRTTPVLVTCRCPFTDFLPTDG
jgi:hypothetical protein